MIVILLWVLLGHVRLLRVLIRLLVPLVVVVAMIIGATLIVLVVLKVVPLISSLEISSLLLKYLFSLIGILVEEIVLGLRGGGLVVLSRLEWYRL